MAKKRYPKAAMNAALDPNQGINKQPPPIKTTSPGQGPLGKMGPASRTGYKARYK